MGEGVVLVVGVVVVALVVAVVVVVGVAVAVVEVVVVLTWEGGCRGGLLLVQAAGSVGWSEEGSRAGVFERGREEVAS